MSHQESVAVRSGAGVDRAGEILRLLRDGEGRTTSELAAMTELARSTVQQRLELLRAHQLVATGPVLVGARGRPAQVYRFAGHGAVVLGIHVGLTGSRVAVIDLAGRVLAEIFVETALEAGPDRVLDAIVGTGRRLLGDASDTLAGIGVGLPSRTDLIIDAVQRGVDPTAWQRDGWARRLRAELDAPVFLDLDVNLMAAAELQRHRVDREVLVAVKVGTVIDAAIVVNGRPVRGLDDRAGELGHVKVAGSREPCSCGGSGCLDAVASGRALVRQLRATGAEVTDVRDVVELARRGDPAAVGAIRDAGRQLGQALATVVTLLNPGVIAVWGYLGEAETTLFAGIREGLYSDALPSASAELELVRTAFGELSGVRGAATMVTGRLLEAAAVDRLLTTGSWQAAWPETPA